MSSKLQLTTLAVLVSAALPAQAALYKVVEVTPGVSGSEYYGTAIQPSPIADNTTFPKGCFEKDCGLGTDYKLAGETRDRPDGFSYREEVPFAMDNSFGYIEDDYDGFEDYCFFQLGYATCEYWASDRWSSWSNETYGSDTPNSLAFIEGTAKAPAGAINTVINSFSKASGSVNTIGNYSTSSKRNEVFSDVANADILTKPQSRAWASDGTYVVGSTSTKSGVGDNRYYYSSSPAIWDASNLISIARAGGSEKDGDYYSQGSMRDFYIDTTAFYGVGYNNYNDQHMNATIFVASSTDPMTATWSQKQISGAEVDAGDDNTNTNSVATNINKNLVVVGQAKRSGSYPQNGAAANRLFVVENVNSPSAHFFDGTDGSIFFNGVGGEMGGINNYNEIVGRIDSENHREYDGKQRRQRAFIYPYGLTSKVTDSTEQAAITDRKAIFQNKAWLLDDLTNDGSTTGNNQYRIYDATDINDAGVISATAVMCPGGYDSTAHNAYCDDGNGDETVVAVKLVPIVDEAQRNIEPRIYESTASERQGAGLGFGALTLLGLFGFMRKRIK
ncbi:DUF3466 family protein [Aliivibrio sifiae]|uniref:GlyGly-CTERM sorting domain-containing protein n=1 Tax=Aliivibrio sifiae TaxID=566293 RepID=A0A2S7XJC3_9GAMM|nr:DUF3466 family protein [Aliivibrio sifiae]PQJ93482.1 hypothetical protein BTO23_05155 [Aliivibrio sifiae]GLR74428.1 hypothetical protein GCM10007855_13020 [Aliivibrio sifiae]